MWPRNFALESIIAWVHANTNDSEAWRRRIPAMLHADRAFLACQVTAPTVAHHRLPIIINSSTITCIPFSFNIKIAFSTRRTCTPSLLLSIRSLRRQSQYQPPLHTICTSTTSALRELFLYLPSARFFPSTVPFVLATFSFNFSSV